MIEVINVKDYYPRTTCLTVLPTASKSNSDEDNCCSSCDQPDSPFPSLPPIEKRVPEWENLRVKLENVARDSEKDTIAIPSKNAGGYVTIADQTYKFGDTLWLYLQAYFANRFVLIHFEILLIFAYIGRWIHHTFNDQLQPRVL